MILGSLSALSAWAIDVTVFECNSSIFSYYYNIIGKIHFAEND